MEINLLWNIIFASTLSQGIFVSLILLIQYFKNKHLSQLILGAFIFVFTAILTNNFLYWNQALTRYPHFIYSTVSTRFLLAPLFYLFCKTFISSALSKQDILHFLPFFIITILFSPYLLMSGADKILSITSNLEEPSQKAFLISTALSWLFAFQLLAYPVFIYRQLKNYLKVHSTIIDENKMNQIKWLKFLNSLFSIYGILMLLYFILIAFQIGGIEKDFYISFVMCIAVYSISYINMTNPDLLKRGAFLDQIQHLKYSRTRLKKEYLESIVKKMEEIMQSEELYLDSDFSLNLMAKKLDIPRHYISQALSLELNKTFHEYINQYRIRHACEMLDNLAEDSNIKTVMYASGFNNRASFNHNFKKFKGMTATAYLRDQ